jgi:hypothetical protein
LATAGHSRRLLDALRERLLTRLSLVLLSAFGYTNDVFVILSALVVGLVHLPAPVPGLVAWVQKGFVMYVVCEWVFPDL